MKPYYDDGQGIAIYHGDCDEILPLLGRASVDAVVTDPPFSVPVKYQDATGDYPRSWGDLAVMEPFFRSVFGSIRTLTKDTGQVYIHCDQESYPVFFKAAYPFWPQSHLICWYKPTGRRGRGWLHSFELVMHLRTPTTDYRDGFRQDLIGIMPVRTLDRQHPAEKPGALCDFLFDAVPASRPGGAPPLVLDPFAGSGATLWAAKRRGWRAIGIEIEERWCEVAADRLRQQALPLFEEAAG